MNMKDAAYATGDDLGLSFENYLLSHYEECCIGRRVMCVVCKAPASSSYSHRGQIIDCHKECLAFLLFYQFMHLYDVVAAGERAGGSIPSLMKLYEMPYEIVRWPFHKYKCCFCEAKTAYFKCASENCTNFYHVQCNTNGLVIAHHTSPNGKQPSYRFSFCQTHMNPYEIDLVKCRFHSKVSRMSEYEIFQKAVNGSQSGSSEADAMSSTRNSNAAKANKRQQSLLRQIKPERKGINTRSASIKKKMEDNILLSNDVKVEKGSSSSKTVQQNEKMTHINDCISSLVNEYGVLKRQLYQKNIKRFDWWPYEILFTKIGPDVFDKCTPGNNTPGDLYKDLRGVLCFGEPMYTMDDMKKVALECEPCVVNISNSITSQLQMMSISSNTSKLNTNGASDNNDRMVQSGGHEMIKQEDSYTNNMPMNYMARESTAMRSSGTELSDDVFEIIGYKNIRPTFALTRRGNAGAWLSCLHLRSKKLNTHKMALVDYISLGALEYEYFKRVLRSIYHLREQEKVIPILSRPAYIQQPRKDEEEETKNVNIGGFSWDNDDPVAAMYLKNAEMPASDSPTSMGLGIHNNPLEDVIGAQIVDENVNEKSETPEGETFVVKQASSLLKMLKAINSAIETHKKGLREKMEVEQLYTNRMHENKVLVEQYTKVAVRMNRWSHFRWSLHQAVDQFNYMLKHEGNGESDQERVAAIKEVEEKEFCSVCLVSEQAYKQLMHQCARCFMRVHYRCYVSYKPVINESAGSTTKGDDTPNKWYCDPCDYEILMNANSKTATCNSAVCCVCCSSGGALKRVAEGTSKRSAPYLQPKWIHLHCAAFLMPKITCLDWMGLSKWDIRGLKLNSSIKCSICHVAGGHTMRCFEEGCTSVFHITCAWVTGAYVGESPIHNTSEMWTLLKPLGSELYPTLGFKVACSTHTKQRFSESAVEALQKRRCIAYTHYLHNPQSTLKETKEIKSHSLPLKPCASPVTITKTGPVKSQVPVKESIPSVKDVVYTPVYQRQHDVTMRQLKVPMMQTTPEVLQPVPQQVMMNPQHPGVIMVNSPHGMMMNGGHGMILGGGHPVIIGGTPAIMQARPPTMIMNGGHPMVINGTPSLIMNGQHPRMMMSPPQGMMQNEMQKPMQQMVYGMQRTYVNEQPRYGVSAIASHLSSNGYPQPVPQSNMSPMEIPMQRMMAQYGTPMTAIPINGTINPMAQHTQYATSGYMQPVQMVPKYWNPRMNQMQYKEAPHTAPDNPYLGMGYMQH